VKLLDFSVAKLLEGDRMKTQAGVVFGTPQYMSPEQGRGLPLDARSDLYALGILAFEMLTGNVPYNDDNPMTVIQMHLHGQVPPMPDSVPYSVQAIVRRAMEKDPSRRYQSAGEMMQHCQQVFAELNAGGVAVGAGGVPRTVIAGPQGNMGGPMPQQGYGQPPQAYGQRPGMPPGAGGPPGGGYAPAGAEAKTMIAQPSPFAQGMPGAMPGTMPGGMPGGPQAPGGYQATAPSQKTIVAGVAPPIVGGQLMPGQMPPGMGGTMPGQMGQMGGMPQGTPGAGFPPQGGAGGPQKTVMLQPSEGVVSMARTGGAVPVATGPVVQGASTLYWIVCLATGIAVGVLGYVIVLQM
jgi:serine/threonine-protein kinase